MGTNAIQENSRIGLFNFLALVAILITFVYHISLFVNKLTHLMASRYDLNMDITSMIVTIFTIFAISVMFPDELQRQNPTSVQISLFNNDPYRSTKNMNEKAFTDDDYLSKTNPENFIDVKDEDLPSHIAPDELPFWLNVESAPEQEPVSHDFDPNDTDTEGENVKGRAKVILILPGRRKEVLKNLEPLDEDQFLTDY